MGFPSWLRKEINRNLESLIHYPDPEQKMIKLAGAEHFSISPDRIIFGNGASEFISLLPDILNIEHLVIPVPSYSEYQKTNDKIKTTYFRMNEENGFVLDTTQLQLMLESLKGKKMVYIGQPNNPTGRSVPVNELIDLAMRNKSTFFCIDESFADFIPGYTTIGIHTIENIITIRSLTKFYGIPGLRLGVCLCDPGIIDKISEARIPWSVNTLAIKIGEKLYSDNEFFENSILNVSKLRNTLMDKLSTFSWLKIYPGEANFLLLKIINPILVLKDLYSFLAENGVIIRLCDNFIDLDNTYFRIAVKTDKENERLIKLLTDFNEKNIRDDSRPANKVPLTHHKKARSLMIQGTASNAGKSVLTAGLCRVLYREGYAVAPFKAQNMSNNSAVTPGGLEIGRAQALQARACNIVPDVRMNPVLLKPSSDKGSQVVLNGLATGHMNAENWSELKHKARAVIQENYDNLASEYDIIILEGAGSPGEVNLKKNDIVNMGMARYADSPVLITGDIDRGGVYASFIGTMAVFEEWERNLVKGFIVNRFRGEEALLTSAHDYLLEYTGKPVLGTIPFISDLNLPEEDSVSFKNGSYLNSTVSDAEIIIGLVDLPYISNFTDMDPLLMEPNVRIVLISDEKLLKDKYDCIIIPGSKNTIGDLSWLNSKGIRNGLTLQKEKGASIMGICGGFQMLGERIEDRDHIESTKESSNDFIEGLGMIGIETVFHSEKQLMLKKVLHIPSGCQVKGYEIHHGVSRLKHGEIIIDSKDGLLGASSPDGSVWGTYLHGIFDDDGFRLWFLNNLRKKKGLPLSKQPQLVYDIDAALDRLADVLTEHLDIRQIKKIIGL